LTVRKEILGSLGGALAVARSVGGETGALLARAARSAFMSGVEVAFVVGAIAAVVGATIMIARLPSKAGETLTTIHESPN